VLGEERFTARAVAVRRWFEGHDPAAEAAAIVEAFVAEGNVAAMRVDGAH